MLNLDGLSMNFPTNVWAEVVEEEAVVSLSYFRASVIFGRVKPTNFFKSSFVRSEFDEVYPCLHPFESVG